MNDQGYYVTSVRYADDEFKIVSFIKGVEKQSINKCPPQVYNKSNVDAKVEEIYDKIWNLKFKE